MKVELNKFVKSKINYGDMVVLDNGMNLLVIENEDGDPMLIDLDGSKQLDYYFSNLDDLEEYLYNGKHSIDNGKPLKVIKSQDLKITLV